MKDKAIELLLEIKLLADYDKFTSVFCKDCIAVFNCDTCANFKWFSEFNNWLSEYEKENK